MLTSPTYRIRRASGSQLFGVDDQLISEQPFEIRLGIDSPPGRAWVVTMRTPGRDHELAFGHLWSEGVVEKISDFVGFRSCGVQDTKSNTCFVRLTPAAFKRASSQARKEKMNASCGLCGKSSLDALQEIEFFNRMKIIMQPRFIYELCDRFAGLDSLYQRTGGSHACAFYSLAGELEFLGEDVGRHNALDKLIGASLKQGRTQLAAGYLLLSGRVSYEMVQKAASMQVSSIVSFGAPTSLAVDLASRYNMNLVGFVKASGMNFYSETRDHV